MSRTEARAYYDKQAGDPDKGYINPADAQSAIDVIYRDMEAGDQAHSGGGGGAALPASPLLGKSGANEARWREALRTARRGGKAARILCVGTSNTFGWGPSDPATMNWPALLARNLEGRLGMRAVWGLEPLNKFTIPNGTMAHTRPWFGGAGTWNLKFDSYIADSGAVEGEPGQGDGPTCTMNVKEGFSFLYVDRTAGRTFQYKVENGSPQTITTAGTNKLIEKVVTVPAEGQHTLSFHNPVGGTAILYAIGEYTDGGISIMNWGIPGIVTSKLLNNQNDWFGGLAAMAGVKPDLVLLEMGVNDTGTAAEFTTAMTTIVNYLKANTQATIVLCESYGTNKTTFIPAARTLAESLGVYSLSWMDLMQGDRDPWRASQSDPDHMSREGYEVIAQGITEVVLGAVPPMLFSKAV